MVKFSRHVIVVSAATKAVHHLSVKQFAFIESLRLGTLIASGFDLQLLVLERVQELLAIQSR